jgi:3-isopropylmalate/(R)-2-methylmalate dehydratase small subunit
LPVRVDEVTHRQLLSLAAEDPAMPVNIDLERQTVTLPDGRALPFPIDSFSKTCLLEGLDQLGYLLKQEVSVAAYETTHPARVNTGQ